MVSSVVSLFVLIFIQRVSWAIRASPYVHQAYAKYTFFPLDRMVSRIECFVHLSDDNPRKDDYYCIPTWSELFHTGWEVTDYQLKQTNAGRELSYNLKRVDEGNTVIVVFLAIICAGALVTVCWIKILLEQHNIEVESMLLNFVNSMDDFSVKECKRKLNNIIDFVKRRPRSATPPKEN
jgi:hypothetical protein